MKTLRIFLFTILSITVSLAQDSTQTFLSLRNTGVETFQKAHPDYDGRGTIVLILDTGIDMGVDGLTKTSTGKIKVIDVQDFTGQGDIPYYEADTDEDNDTLYFVNEDKNYKVAGADKLSLKAADDKYFIGLLSETLWKNSGSGATDVNKNGTEDDKFFFIVFKTQKDNEQFWVVFLDTDADGDLSDEKPLRNYKEKFDSFTFANKDKLSSFTLALNIFPKENLVKFFFDDGSHGTHCAGISTGNKIGDEQLYGIAPGANLIGLKIGNNNLAGGATVAESMKKAYLYADKISKEREEPCIINMSFGIGAEIEAKADIEKFLDKLVADNPYLYIATSNGNEGPGLSTTGMPASTSSIFSSGAVLAQEVGNNLYGTTLDRDIILHFSSRGGEVNKPDVVSPGACVSTVPNFSHADRFWGTSMASPYSAGVMAVLLGAMKVEYPKVKIPSRLLYMALRESAKPMEGYDYVDQGGGLINIKAAYKLLKKYITRGEVNNFETYTISSFAPNMPSGHAPALYIRDASYLNGSEKFSFSIKRNNTIDKNKFYRFYRLKSTAKWFKPIEKKIHIRNNQSATVNVQIDKSILGKPGLYNAKIIGTRTGKFAMPEFELMATIIVPYKFCAKNKYKIIFENEKIKPAMHKRYFLKIPNGTSTLKLSVESGIKDYTFVRYYLHSPDGRKKLFSYLSATNDEGKKVNYISDLTPGVYELVVLGQFTSNEESIYTIKAEIDGVNLLSKALDEENQIKCVNYFDKVKYFNLSGKIPGYLKEYDVEFNGEKTHKIPFTLKEGEAEKIFEVSLTKEDYNKVTDFALMIYDKDGKAKAIGGLSYKSDKISVNKSSKDDEESFEFVMIPGFANAPGKLKVHIIEKTILGNDINMKVTKRGRTTLVMYPNINYTLKCKYKLPEKELPKNAHYFGEIEFKSLKTDDVELTKQIIVK